MVRDVAWWCYRCVEHRGMFFIDKDPEDEHEDNDGIGPEEIWETFKIIGITWVPRTGWYLDCKVHDDLAGQTYPYAANDLLLRMIRWCPMNTKQMRSRVAQ